MKPQPLGLIEGFFGQPWPEQDRLSFAPFLQQRGFDFYLYAPKADPLLRKRWRESWPEDYASKLRGLGNHFRQHGVSFGVGLSPFGLHELSSAEGKKTLEEKIHRLNEIGIDLLGLFFDDMPVHADLAQRQLEAINLVRQSTRARIIFCPSFYSPDPILEKVFGRRPAQYWEEISKAPKEIDFAWTGPKVISDEIPIKHLEEAAELLGRKPFLWDNLFANDGPRNCKFLKIRGPKGRTTAALEHTNGWAWNPMNQAHLSRIVLLATRHAMLDHMAPEFALARAIEESCPPSLAAFVSTNRKAMLEQGLDKIDLSMKDAWAEELKEWDHPVAVEIARWLAEGYLVGSECLTD